MVRVLLFFIIIAVALSGCAAAEEDPLPKPQDIEASDCDDPGPAAAIIDEVLARFQPDLKEIAGIEEIIFCKDLKFRDVPVPAAAAQKEGRTAIYIDVRAPLKIDVSFTHELFHAIEFHNPLDAEAWAKINPYENYPFDTSVRGDIFYYKPNMTPAFEPGFVSDYARFSGKEDRAELFTILYSDREIRPKERAALLSDRFLGEKIEFLKTYLENAGFERGTKDNLFVETNYVCGVYKLVKPELARTGPSESYPSANLKAGQVLADSGFERDGIKMLFDCDAGFSRIYAPLSALEYLDTTTLCVFPR